MRVLYTLASVAAVAVLVAVAQDQINVQYHGHGCNNANFLNANYGPAPNGHCRTSSCQFLTHSFINVSEEVICGSGKGLVAEIAALGTDVAVIDFYTTDACEEVQSTFASASGACEGRFGSSASDTCNPDGTVTSRIFTGVTCDPTSEFYNYTVGSQCITPPDRRFTVSGRCVRGSGQQQA